MANLSEKTTISKSFYGWKGETLTKVGEQSYLITTLKRANKQITSDATAVKVLPSGSYQYDVFSSKNFKLLSETGKATKEKVNEVHLKALLVFDEQIKEHQTKEAYKIEKGQIIFLNGYGQNEHYHEKKAIYDIVTNPFGTYYKYVNLKTLELGTTSHLKPVNQLFGIGVYYFENEKIDLNELNNILIDAKQKEAKQTKEREASNLLEGIRTNAKIEEGLKGLNIPVDTKAVIVADLMKDESEPETDYFHSSVSKRVYLAFSKHNRDLFNEMRNACKNADIQEINAFSVAPKINVNGETLEAYLAKMKDYYKNEKEAAKYWHPEDEHRNKYSMGDGYYLGEKYKRSGWQIRKINIDVTKASTKELLAIAKAENRYFCQTSKAPEIKPEKSILKVDSNLKYIDYSEKAFAIVGDTKAIKDKLKSLGGRFNPRLNCGAGWIFSKKNEANILNVLNIKKEVAAS